jgi:hypothetical protein
VTAPLALAAADAEPALLRFRLRGPAATAVLQHVVRPAAPVAEAPGPGALGASLWRRARTLPSPALLPRRCVLGLTALDPRLVAPLSPAAALARAAAAAAAERAPLPPLGPEDLVQWPAAAAHSALWDPAAVAAAAAARASARVRARACRRAGDQP